MAAEIIDGKALADEIRRQIAEEVADLTSHTGVVPGLSVILVGDDPASRVYVGSKQKASAAAGMNGAVVRLPAETSQAELLATIEQLNDDPMVHGILVQMPLPRHIDERAVIERVTPSKDVDGFHPVNFGLLAQGRRGSCRARHWASASCCSTRRSRPEAPTWSSWAGRNSWASPCLSCSSRKDRVATRR